MGGGGGGKSLRMVDLYIFAEGVDGEVGPFWY